MRLKWPEPEDIHKAEFPKLSALVAQSLLILRHYYVQIIKDRFRIQVYKIKKEGVGAGFQIIAGCVSI